MARIHEVGDEVVGKRHPHPGGRVCVHILAPFGQCAADSRPELLGPGAEDEELLRRLYQVCRWAEEHSGQLAVLDGEIRAVLERDESLLDSETLAELLTNRDVTPERLEEMGVAHDYYEAALARRARHHATVLGCPWPEIAASGSEFLAMNRFFEGGRCATVRESAS